MIGKIIKKILRALGAFIIVLLATLLATLLILRSPVAQTNIARIFAAHMTKELGTEVSIDMIRIGLRSIVIKGLYVEDHKKYPLIDSKEVRVSPLSLNFGQGDFRFRKVIVDSTSFNLRKYSGEEKVNLNRIIEFFKSSEADSIAREPGQLQLSCNNIELTGVSFSLFNEDKLKETTSMDYADLDISEIDLAIGDFKLSGDTITAFIENLTAKEKSGFHLKSFRGDCLVSSTGFRVDSLEIMTNNSFINMDLVFDYYHYQAFEEFIDSVRMMADIKPSKIQMADIGYFTESLKVMQNEVRIECGFKGSVANWHTENLKFSTGKSLKFSGDVAMKGIPDILNTYSMLNIDYLYANKYDIESFALPIKGKYLKMPEELVNLGDFKISGSFDGVYNDFISKARLDSELGTLITDLAVTYNSDADLIGYNGNLSTEELDLGTFLGIGFLGQLTMQGEINGNGLSGEDVNLYLSATIDTLGFYGNNYEQLTIGGELSEKKFNGKFVVEDTLADIEFIGIIDFERSRPLMNFKLIAEEARLYQMNLTSRATDSEISGEANVIVDFASLDDWRGTVRIDDVRYLENAEEYRLDSLLINGALHPEGPDWMRVVSDIADVSLNGDFSLSGFYPDLEESFNSYLYDTISPGSDKANTYFSLSLELKDTEQLSDLFVPSLRLSDNSVLAGSFDRNDNDINFRFTSDSISYGTVKFSDVVLQSERLDERLEVKCSSNTVTFREEDPSREAGRLGMDNLLAMMEIEKGKVNWNFIWDDETVNDFNRADIKGLISLDGPGRYVGSITQMDARINGMDWYLDKENKIVIDTTLLSIDGFDLYSKDQRLVVSGRVSKADSDTIHFVFSNWDLANFNPLIVSSSITLDGNINGKADLSGLYSNPSVLSDIIVSDFSFNKEQLGELVISTGWIRSDSSFTTKVQILEKGNISKYKTVDVSGVYYPYRDKDVFDFDIELNNLSLSMAEPFLRSIMSEVSGIASGKLTLRGNFEKPLLTGMMKLMRTELLVDYLNVKYSLAHDVLFDENVILMQDALVYDSEGNRIVANARLSHNYFNDFYIDLDFKPENAMAMNTTRYMNDVFYGKAFASGEVSISGPFDDISMDISASPSKGTDLTIPLQYSVDVSQSDFIVFTSELEAEEQNEAGNKYKANVKGLNLNLDLAVNRNADLQMFLPGDMGYIKAIGDGDLELDIDSRGYFTIDGSYVLADGLFNFNLEQLISKRFQINEGSRITWDGDVYDADVNIAAIFKTKTTLAGLGMALPAGTENQRVNVHLYVILTGNLFNPNIRFSVRFPYLQEAVKSNIYALMDTTDNSIMNQQAISLLVLNSFSSPGYTSTTNPINSYSIIANQLSSVLSKISNDFDIGINYIPGDEISSEEVEVALSTQLFDNRLIIDGNVDVPTSNSSQNTSNIVGEVNIEYKLTPDGRFRVRAFNRSNNLNMLETYAPYTQGVGLFYRRDFNRIGDLFKRDEERIKAKKERQKARKNKLD